VSMQVIFTIIGLFEGTAAWTGASEKTLKRISDEDCEKIYLYPNSHAGYYPSAKPISHWHEMEEGVILDVREPFEHAVENVEGAINIPLEQLRGRLYNGPVY